VDRVEVDPLVPSGSQEDLDMSEYAHPSSRRTVEEGKEKDEWPSPDGTKKRGRGEDLRTFKFVKGKRELRPRTIVRKNKDQ